MPGPAPTPKHISKLRGNPGKRAKGKGDTPSAPPAAIRAPNGLSPDALRYWRQCAAELSAAGLLTEIDKPALHLLAETYANWRQALDQTRQDGVVKEMPFGEVRSPWATERDNAAKQYIALLKEFGMTPAARNRVAVQAPKKADPLESFLLGQEAKGNG